MKNGKQWRIAVAKVIVSMVESEQEAKGMMAHKKYPILLEEKESDGTIVRYTYAGNRERVHADVTAKGDNAKTQSYSLYTDRLGSTRWALDENAEVAAKTEYDAWGKPETETVSSKLNGINISKSYTGYVYDETTGYWNAGARMYNSTDREFIQKDPKVGNVYETLTQNGYIYCGDNPLYYIDPDGCSYISILGNAGRTAFNVVKSGVAGGLGFYTRVCCEIDNMPTWAKVAIGTTGIIIAGASGVGAAAIAETVIASAGISAATDGAFYSIYALNNGSFSKSELKDTVINGAVNGYMFGGAGVGVAGIRNAAKSGKLAGFMADEAGSVSYEGGRKTIDDIINGLAETTNGKGVARNFESTGDFEKTIRDFDALNPIDVKEIQTKYGLGKVGKLSDGTTVVARSGSTTGGATLEIRVSNRKVYKIRY